VRQLVFRRPHSSRSTCLAPGTPPPPQPPPSPAPSLHSPLAQPCIPTPLCTMSSLLSKKKIVIDGKQYNLKKLLAEGSNGYVYTTTLPSSAKREKGSFSLESLSLDTAPKAKGAVKVMICMDENSMRHSVREIEVMTAVEHGNVCSLIDSLVVADPRGTPNNDISPHPFVVIVCPLYDHGDLESFVTEHGALPLSETLMIFKGVCHGVKALHANGFRHNDIKPLNILLKSSEGGENADDLPVPALTVSASMANLRKSRCANRAAQIASFGETAEIATGSKRPATPPFVHTYVCVHACVCVCVHACVCVCVHACVCVSHITNDPKRPKMRNELLKTRYSRSNALLPCSHRLICYGPEVCVCMPPCSRRLPPLFTHVRDRTSEAAAPSSPTARLGRKPSRRWTFTPLRRRRRTARRNCGTFSRALFWTHLATALAWGVHYTLCFLESSVLTITLARLLSRAARVTGEER